MLRQNDNFYAKICFDILFEVLRFGDRRLLVKLERIGRRFHLIVEKYFDKMQFLRLDIGLYPGFPFFSDIIKFYYRFFVNI